MFGRAPLAGDHHVVPEVPPEVVGQLLRSAILLPLARDVEALVIHQEDAAGAVAVRRAERADVDGVRAAVDGVRAAVAALRHQLVRLNRLDDLRAARVRLRVHDVHARRLQARHQQVAPLDVRVRHVRAERRAAGVPAEMVQLVADVRQIEPADNLPVGCLTPGSRPGRPARPACCCRQDSGSRHRPVLRVARPSPSSAMGRSSDRVSRSPSLVSSHSSRAQCRGLALPVPRSV